MTQPKTARAASADRALQDAERVSAHLEAIRKVQREAIWQQARRLDVPLTAPQLHALQILVDEQRQTARGLSLSELSKRMGLAHSTVSGIVDRLEHRNLLKRRPHPDDRRFVSIELTGPVKQWLERELPATRHGPLALAMSKASDRERAAVLTGLDTLQRLLGVQAP